MTTQPDQDTPENAVTTGKLVDFGLSPETPTMSEHQDTVPEQATELNETSEDPEPLIDLQAVPENPDGYAISVDEGLGGVDAALNERLHKAGFNNAQAQLVYDLAGEIIPSMVEQVQQAGQRASDRAALVAEFGGAQAWKSLAPRIEKWGRENLPDAAFDAMCQTASGVKALHRLMTAGKEAGLGRSDTSEPTAGMRSDIQRKMNDPRYWRDRDPVIVAEVQAAFSRLHD